MTFQISRCSATKEVPSAGHVGENIAVERDNVKIADDGYRVMGKSFAVWRPPRVERKRYEKRNHVCENLCTNLEVLV